MVFGRYRSLDLRNPDYTAPAGVDIRSGVRSVARRSADLLARASSGRATGSIPIVSTSALATDCGDLLRHRLPHRHICCSPRMKSETAAGDIGRRSGQAPELPAGGLRRADRPSTPVPQAWATTAGPKRERMCRRCLPRRGHRRAPVRCCLRVTASTSDQTSAIRPHSMRKMLIPVQVAMRPEGGRSPS